MYHSIGHMLRRVTDQNMIAKAFMERLQNRDGELQSKMFIMMANLSGSKEYFTKLGMEIKWIIKRPGPPILFVTCSIAEWFSKALIEHLKISNKDVPNIHNMTPAELCLYGPCECQHSFSAKVECHLHQTIQGQEHSSVW